MNHYFLYRIDYLYNIDTSYTVSQKMLAVECLPTARFKRETKVTRIKYWRKFIYMYSICVVLVIPNWCCKCILPQWTFIPCVNLTSEKHTYPEVMLLWYLSSLVFWKSNVYTPFYCHNSHSRLGDIFLGSFLVRFKINLHVVAKAFATFNSFGKSYWIIAIYSLNLYVLLKEFIFKVVVFERKPALHHELFGHMH